MNLVLDPTLLIDKKYYLEVIKNYKNNEIQLNENYLFIYQVQFAKKTNLVQLMNKFINKATKELKYKIYNLDMYVNDSVEKFLSGIYYSKAVITNSFHATIFSIIFNKPFITFRTNDDERLDSLKKSLYLNNRILEYTEIPDLNLLKNSLIMNETNLNLLKIKSFNYLKKI